MKELLLLHAGAPKEALRLIPAIVDTCRSCRLWARPGPRSITASISRMAQSFNELVQWDILFHRDLAISHMVDEATRWCTASVLPSKSAASIITAITRDWLRPHGAMKVLIADQERGLLSDEASQWHDRWQIEKRSKGPGTHAY